MHAMRECTPSAAIECLAGSSCGSGPASRLCPRYSGPCPRSPRSPCWPSLASEPSDRRSGRSPSCCPDHSCPPGSPQRSPGWPRPPACAIAECRDNDESLCMQRSGSIVSLSIQGSNTSRVNDEAFKNDATTGSLNSCSNDIHSSIKSSMRGRSLGSCAQSDAANKCDFYRVNMYAFHDGKNVEMVDVTNGAGQGSVTTEWVDQEPK